jgi:hypothetical protein
MHRLREDHRRDTDSLRDPRRRVPGPASGAEGSVLESSVAGTAHGGTGTRSLRGLRQHGSRPSPPPLRGQPGQPAHLPAGSSPVAVQAVPPTPRAWTRRANPGGALHARACRRCTTGHGKGTCEADVRRGRTAGRSPAIRAVSACDAARNSAATGARGVGAPTEMRPQRVRRPVSREKNLIRRSRTGGKGAREKFEYRWHARDPSRKKFQYSCSRRLPISNASALLALEARI